MSCDPIRVLVASVPPPVIYLKRVLSLGRSEDDFVDGLEGVEEEVTLGGRKGWEEGEFDGEGAGGFRGGWMSGEKTKMTRRGH